MEKSDAKFVENNFLTDKMPVDMLKNSTKGENLFVMFVKWYSIAENI